MGTQAESAISVYLSGLKKDYGGKRCVFNEERNKGKVGQDRSGRGREFHFVGRQTKNGRPNIGDCEEEFVNGSEISSWDIGGNEIKQI